MKENKIKISKENIGERYISQHQKKSLKFTNIIGTKQTNILDFGWVEDKRKGGNRLAVVCFERLKELNEK